MVHQKNLKKRISLSLPPSLSLSLILSLCLSVSSISKLDFPFSWFPGETQLLFPPRVPTDVLESILIGPAWVICPSL